MLLGLTNWRVALGVHLSSIQEAAASPGEKITTFSLGDTHMLYLFDYQEPIAFQETIILSVTVFLWKWSIYPLKFILQVLQLLLLEASVHLWCNEGIKFSLCYGFWRSYSADSSVFSFFSDFLNAVRWNAISSYQVNAKKCCVRCPRLHHPCVCGFFCCTYPVPLVFFNLPALRSLDLACF